MRRFALPGIALLLALAAACDDPSKPVAPPTDLQASQDPGPAPDRYIVVLGFQTANVDGEVARLSGKHAGNVERVFRHALKGYVAVLSDVEAAALRAEAGVELVERDAPVQADIIQSNATWGIDRIDQRNLPLSGTYTYNASGSGVSVYVIDTGIRVTHNEFGGRATGAFTSINDGNGTNDCAGHGTHVAGTIGGTTYGVAKGVALYAVRVLNCSGSGTTSGVIAGIDWVTANAAKPAVANMSLGGAASTALDAAVNNSIASGVTYSISAGNSNANACNQSPARVVAALTVGATNASDARASFSNYGGCVDLFAPGVSITSAYNSGNSATAVLSGTSMSAPHVAGAAALYLQTQPAAAPSGVAQALASNATAGVVTNPAGSPNLLLYSGFIGTPPPPGKLLSIYSGNNQTLQVNTMTGLLKVLVTNLSGTPLGGVPVTYKVTSGGGTLLRYQDVTGLNGTSNTRWTLGPLVGVQTMEASISGAPPVTFTATATAPPPTLLLSIYAGNNQTYPVNTMTGLLKVLVTDLNGTPLAGIPVTYKVTSGGGTLLRDQDTTGPNGTSNTRWTLGPVVGVQTMEASISGAPPVTFTITAN